MNRISPGTTIFVNCTEDEIEEPILDEKQTKRQKEIIENASFIVEQVYKCGCNSYSWEENNTFISIPFYCSKH